MTVICPPTLVTFDMHDPVHLQHYPLFIPIIKINNVAHTGKGGHFSHPFRAVKA